MKNNRSERIICMNDLWLKAEKFSAVSHRYRVCKTHILELQSEYITTEKRDQTPLEIVCSFLSYFILSSLRPKLQQ